MDQIELLQRLGVALAIGILIGGERGWQARDEDEGERVAGLRTFTLVALLGGIWGLLANKLHPIVPGLVFLGFAGIMGAAYYRAKPHPQERSATTVVAALVTFGLGAYAAMGNMTVAVVGAGATTVILGTKALVHGWLRNVRPEEMNATLKFVAIAALLLPILPNRALDPWGALNPFEIWLMVVVIAGLSFAGYVLMRLAGAGTGVLLSGLAGGLVSSTAATLNFARMAKDHPTGARLFASGAVLAASVMFVRTLAIVSVLQPGLVSALWPPVAGATLAGCAASAVLWHRTTSRTKALPFDLPNPLELTVAIKFGVLLAAIILASNLIAEHVGDLGLFTLSFVAGLADVDTVTLSFAKDAGPEGPILPSVAMTGILLAMLANTVAKASLALAVGGKGFGGKFALTAGAMVMGGAIGLVLGQ